MGTDLFGRLIDRRFGSALKKLLMGFFQDLNPKGPSGVPGYDTATFKKHSFSDGLQARHFLMTKGPLPGLNR